jgi:hypothetical protein
MDLKARPYTSVVSLAARRASRRCMRVASLSGVLCGPRYGQRRWEDAPFHIGRVGYLCRPPVPLLPDCPSPGCSFHQGWCELHWLSPRWESQLSGFSRTTVAVSARTPSQRLRPCSRSRSSMTGPSVPKPTAKRKASTRRCSESGRIAGRITRTLSASMLCNLPAGQQLRRTAHEHRLTGHRLRACRQR